MLIISHVNIPIRKDTQEQMNYLKGKQNKAKKRKRKKNKNILRDREKKKRMSAQPEAHETKDVL